MDRSFNLSDVVIREVESVRIAYMEHRGHPDGLNQTVQKFISWRKQLGLHPKQYPTYTVWTSEPRPKDPTLFNVCLCVGINDLEIVEDVVEVAEIPGGRCAVLRVVGHTDNLEDAALFLYKNWLPRSRENVRDFAVYCQRLSFYPDVPADQAVADVFLPLV